MPQQFGPQSYQSRSTDKYTTYNPDNSGNDVTMEVVVPVAVPWNHGRTQLLKDKAVEFGNPMWLKAGCGPYEVFKPRPGRFYEPIGAITWSVQTEVLQRVETKSMEKKRRLLITPYIHPTRTFKPLRNGTPETRKIKSFGSTLRGKWHTIPDEELA